MQGEGKAEIGKGRQVILTVGLEGVHGGDQLFKWGGLLSD